MREWGKWGEVGEQWFDYAVIERSRDSPTGAEENNCQLSIVNCLLTNDYGLWTIYCKIDSVVKAHSKSKAGFDSSVSISRLAFISSEIPVSVDKCVQETQAANSLANGFTLWRK